MVFIIYIKNSIHWCYMAYEHIFNVYVYVCNTEIIYGNMYEDFIFHFIFGLYRLSRDYIIL